MKTKLKRETTRLIPTALVLAFAVSAFARADDIPMPHPKNENLMKNTTARHSAAGMIHFNTVDGEPYFITGSK